MSCTRPTGELACSRLTLLLLTSHIAIVATNTTTRGTITPARWHQQRRAAILSAHPEVAQLASPEPLTLPMLAATNGMQVALCLACAHLPAPALVPVAILLGGTLSLWQFALLHDVKHGTAALPSKVAANDVLFVGSMPSLFGYYLYLRFGHLSHHKNFGLQPIRSLFDSDKSNFEDGDALFVAHRQSMAGDVPDKRVGFAGRDAVGGLGLSISRTIYALLWLDRPESSAMSQYLVASWNALVFAFSMTFERAALVFGGSLVVAITGRNFFFPYKPQSFHDTAAAYARCSLAVQLALLAVAGPATLNYLFWAEVGWQLPVHPASAMFVSNHPSLTASREASDSSMESGDQGCQPTASVYLGDWYDWLCCFSNYHTEHHDFPDVPAFQLRKLRDAAPTFYSEEALNGCRDGWWATMRRTFKARDFYACSGVGTAGAPRSSKE